MAAHQPLREPHDYEIPDYEEFIRTYRYSLINVIDVRHAIPWLMHNDVLDKQDEEKIMKSYETSVLRAGDLIDIVKRRGPRALNVLVEFIEYEYPDMFKTIMRRMAREPDPKVYVPAWKKSTHISEFITSGIDMIMKAFGGSNEAKNQAQESIKNLEVVTSFVLGGWNGGINGQKVLELNTCNNDLRTQLQHAKEERAEIVRKQEMFRQERDKYRCEVQNQKEKLMKDLLQHVKSCQQSYSDTDVKNEAAHQVECDRKCLEDQLDKLADEYDLFRSSVMDQVNSLTDERNQILDQFEDLKQKYDNLQEQNNALKAKLLSNQSTLRIFKSESSIRKAQNTPKTDLFKKQSGNETGVITLMMTKEMPVTRHQ
ncbi:hypothetical protein LSH36_115g03005 [Paralvinella palmiformis]|uniref:CARD domain-containing protein n=1 Tax=Paralvinella palmiformis TaxID=53620 RepID=A0AAD9JYD8_9ANNE|nr:hypothetical protein LSH36_115g03005 [Paralvinella palmiformis]